MSGVPHRLRTSSAEAFDAALGGVPVVRVYCGLASAGQRIPVAVVDDAGRLLTSDEVDDTPAGYAAVCNLIGERCADTGPVRAAMATDSETNLVPLLLAASGEPLAVGDAGTIAQFVSDEPVGGSDPGWRAVALARALQAGTLAATSQPAPRDLTALRPVLSAHRAATVGRSSNVAMLRELLRELYPAALRVFPDPATPLALAVLERFPDPAQLSHDQDGGVAEQLRADGVPDADAALARLRAAVAGMSMRRSSSQAVGPAVRSGIAAVRSAGRAATALLNVIAEHVEPRTGGRGFPAVPPVSSPPVSGPPVSNPPVSGPPVSSPPVSGLVPARPTPGRLPEAPQPVPQAFMPPSGAPVSGPPPMTSPPAAPPEPSRTELSHPSQPPVPDAPAHVPAQGTPRRRRAESAGASHASQPAGAPQSLPQPASPQPAASPPPAMLPPTREPSGPYQQQPSSGSPYSTPPATNGFPTTGPPTPGAWGGHTGAHRQVTGESSTPAYNQTGRSQQPAQPIPPHTGSAVPDQSDEELSLLTPDELPTNPNPRRPPEPELERSSEERPSGRLGALIEFPRLARRNPSEPPQFTPHGQQDRRDTEDEPTQEYRPPSPRRQAATEAPSSAPPLSDSDGDLLIFAQARSAWFSGDGEPGDRADWRTEADAGWNAAEAASRPSVGGTTTSGLPRRVPSANLVPGAAPNRDRAQVQPIQRDAAQLAAHTAGYFRGWNRAREDVNEPPEYSSVRHR